MSSVVINSASQINPLTGAAANASAGATSFSALTDKATADLPATNTPLANALAGKAAVDPASTPLSALRVITALDDRARFTCTTALPMEVPLGLSPPPSWVVFPPASGVVTITPTGGAKINGSTSPITRAFANNRLGVWFVPNPYDANDYSVSGS